MNYGFETRCIHGNGTDEKTHSYGSVAVPIYQAATFAHPGIGQSTGYDYTRESNPTRTELEHTMSALEGAVDTVAELFDRGDHILCTDDLYGGSVRMFESVGGKRGLEFSYVDTADADLVEAGIRENTKALYIETPSNPTMRVTDLRKMKEIADKHNLKIIVDNTFLSPLFQRPIELGADLVIHSGTKFLGGHNDTLAGFLCSADEETAKKIRYIYKTVGSCLAPFDSYLILRGIKTLSVRLRAQQDNAMKIANWLKGHEKVKQVYYVGLKEHPGYGVNASQASGFGSMISFKVDSEATARKLLESVKLIAYAESLGGVESLITYPVEVREKLGITEDFLRLSVGIENADDLIADLEQALA